VIVQNAPADSRLMREEVFGPVLPIAAYDRLEDVPKFLARLSRPLALYFIGGTPAEKQWMLRQTWAGGVTFDGIMLHPFLQDLPFGGVGESGMGRYVGHDGFKTFSNSKSVAHPPVVDVTKFLAPPYGPRVAQLMRRALKL
jgi:coniferyl-aldehyde dehydrogenase